MTDVDSYRDWVGRRRTAADRIDIDRARALQATLDDEAPPLGEGDALPPLWHWIYFWEPRPTAALGPDGHAARGEFLPPVDLPRRMWAGSRLRFPRPLELGARVTRVSTIAGIEAKEGRSGPLVFVTVSHVYSDETAVVIEEEHDIVYRGPAGPPSASSPAAGAPLAPPWQRRVVPGPVLLFRYSALTFNGHRIHYDQPYVTATEGYPGLVVHGPLLATLMVGLVRERAPRQRVTAFTFRALRPVFDTAPFMVAGCPTGEGEGADLWVVDPDGALAMQATAELAPPTP